MDPMRDEANIMQLNDGLGDQSRGSMGEMGQMAEEMVQKEQDKGLELPQLPLRAVHAELTKSVGQKELDLDQTTLAEDGKIQDSSNDGLVRSLEREDEHIKSKTGSDGLVDCDNVVGLEAGRPHHKKQPQINVVGPDTVQPQGIRLGTPLTKPIPKAILSTPTLQKTTRKVRGKENTETNKNGETEKKRKSDRIANRPKSDLTMEEQATQLLMKKCGTLEIGKKAQEEDHDNFREQFAEPLKGDAVFGFRDMFGLTDLPAGEALSALALEADA
ncbi:hypothetical protein BAE44_0017102 [Dichanthelium oligosanthes]|uniref:Uncharacterized protein n=1 Tax=Dichanthelium oligosanthes TaxID=888268 RepID=A0A1E5V9R1_9POAL|nr:hypothetical protein BAE44_0017102 [Dichanthelium oligosanthes]